VDQIHFAPFGDDPVIVSQTTLTNLKSIPVDLEWAEYWGCQMYQFSYRSYMEGYDLGGGKVGAGSQVDAARVAHLRREFAKRFVHQFEMLDRGNCLIEKKRFLGRSREEQQAWDRIQEEMARNPNTFLGPRTKEPSPQIRMEDQEPPNTFLCSLDSVPGIFTTDSAAFFGRGGVLHPDGVFYREENLSASGPESAMIMKKRIRLEPGQSTTLYGMYGYLPEGFTARSLVDRYRERRETCFAESCARWKQEGIALHVDGEPWIDRETSWHNYYLRSGFTYDDFFQEHIVSQGQVYQYVMGFQGAPRDPLQHALPLVFGESSLAKQVLRYTLKSQHADGSLPYGIVGHGMPMPAFFLPSDLDLWLLWLASEYVLATRDRKFLDEQLPTYPLDTGGPELSVRQLLDRSYRHLVQGVGVGKHGLIRGQNDDWNDELYWRTVPEKLLPEVGRESESTMNASMAAYILDEYAEMLRFAGDEKSSLEPAKFAEQQRVAMRAQWSGQWFKRAWFGPSLGWVGEDRMWLETQPWAIVSKIASPEQSRVLADAMDRLLRQPSPIGAKQVSLKVEWPGVTPGETENGGVWAALDGPLIWALASVDGAMAWDEWLKNTRANHAEVYPDVWYGIWSGPDVFNSTDSGHAGQTGYDWGLVDVNAAAQPSTFRGLSWTAWPVMCMHRHAWPLYSAAKLAGIEFTAAGVTLAPAIPKEQYSFESALIGVKKTHAGYEGWYAPHETGVWSSRLRVPNARNLNALSINGGKDVKLPSSQIADDWIEFSGEGGKGKPLIWSVSRKDSGRENS